MEGEAVDVKNRTEEPTKQLGERVDAMEHLGELNHTLIFQERWPIMNCNMQGKS